MNYGWHQPLKYAQVLFRHLWEILDHQGKFGIPFLFSIIWDTFILTRVSLLLTEEMSFQLFLEYCQGSCQCLEPDASSSRQPSQRDRERCNMGSFGLIDQPDQPAAFCISCQGLIAHAGSQAIRALQQSGLEIIRNEELCSLLSKERALPDVVQRKPSCLSYAVSKVSWLSQITPIFLAEWVQIIVDELNGELSECQSVRFLDFCFHIFPLA